MCVLLHIALTSLGASLNSSDHGWLSDESLSLRPRVAPEVTRASCRGPWNCLWTRCRSWTKHCHPLYAASCAAPQTRTRLCWRTQCSSMALSPRRHCHSASHNELFLRCRARSQLMGCAQQQTSCSESSRVACQAICSSLIALIHTFFAVFILPPPPPNASPSNAGGRLNCTWCGTSASCVAPSPPSRIRLPLLNVAAIRPSSTVVRPVSFPVT